MVGIVRFSKICWSSPLVLKKGDESSMMIIEFLVHELCRIVIQCDIQDFAQDSSGKKAIHRSGSGISSNSHNRGGYSEDGDYDTVRNV